MTKESSTNKLSRVADGRSTRGACFDGRRKAKRLGDQSKISPWLWIGGVAAGCCGARTRYLPHTCTVADRRRGAWSWFACWLSNHSGQVLMMMPSLSSCASSMPSISRANWPQITGMTSLTALLIGIGESPVLVLA